MLKEYIGATIQLYPGDSRYKFGKLINVDNSGVLVKITNSNASDYEVGKDYYISFSIGLKLKIAKV